MSEKLAGKSEGRVTSNSRKAFKYRSTECLNCGHPLELTDRFCSYCSQINTTKSLSLKDFFSEFIGSVITYDSRLRFTLKDLLFRPGVITRNYVAGQRLKYANPFRFFLSVSIIYFIIQGLLSSFTGNNQLLQESVTNEQKSFGFSPSGNNFTITSFVENSSDLEPQQKKNLLLLDSVLTDKNVNFSKEQLDSILAEEEIDWNNLDSVIGTANTLPFARGSRDTTYTLISEKALDTMGWFKRNFERFNLYRDFYKATDISNPIVALDSLQHINNGYNRWMYSKNEAIERIENEPGEFLQYLLEKTPFFLFFFTPVYALFFWLIYSKKKYTYMEHMIFIFHIFSFIFLAALICLIPDSIIANGNDNIVFSLVLMLIGPIYFYKALRNFYQQNRLITILKFIFLNWIFWIGATTAALLFFAITAAMY